MIENTFDVRTFLKEEKKRKKEGEGERAVWELFQVSIQFEKS